MGFVYAESLSKKTPDLNNFVKTALFTPKAEKMYLKRIIPLIDWPSDSYLKKAKNYTIRPKVASKASAKLQHTKIALFLSTKA